MNELAMRVLTSQQGNVHVPEQRRLTVVGDGEQGKIKHLFYPKIEQSVCFCHTKNFPKSQD